MTGNESPTVGDVFRLLNSWRHLPFYPLEGRSAPFFAVFLRDVLRAQFGTEMHETVIPEFPLRFGTLDKNDSHPNLSYNVDYVAFAKDKSTAYLVELKTDLGSIRKEQKAYLRKAREKGIPCLAEGVRQLAKVKRPPKKERKYFHLLHLLFAPGPKLLTTRKSPRLVEDELCKGTARWPSSVDQLEIDTTSFAKSKVVFIQPKKGESDECDFEYIYFKRVAEIVETKGDLGNLFAQCLGHWVKEAGSPDPRDIHRS